MREGSPDGLPFSVYGAPMIDHAQAYDLDFAFPAGDTAVGASLRDHGEFARVIPEYLLEAAGDADAALIDVGANIGAVGLPFARRRPGWQVLAIEAHAGLADLCRRNAQANGLGNVEVLTAAAGPASANVAFPTPPLEGARNFGAIGFGDAAPTVETRQVTLDEIAPAATRLVKIDVEGFEPQVLAGAAALLARPDVTWLVEASVQHPQATQATIAALLSADLDVYWFYAPFVTPVSRGGVPKEPALGDANVVARPRGAPNVWDLTRVTRPDEPRPRSLAAYPYLPRYGYVPKVRG